MTRAQLIAKNEALHGLYACEALAFYADPGSWEWGEPEYEENIGTEDEPLMVGVVEHAITEDNGDRARDTLAQIKEGVVP